jgi:hypothetical protein
MLTKNSEKGNHINNGIKDITTGSIVRIPRKVQMNIFISSMRSLFAVHDRKHLIERGCMKQVGQTTTIW